MKKCVVFLNGQYDYTQEFIDELVNNDTFCICADGGANAIFKYNKKPNIIVGDLDSVCKKILKYYKKIGVKIKKYNPKKDFTDFELALKYTKKFKKVYILGALGKKIDMTLSNLFLSQKYKNISFLSQNEEIFFKDKPFVLRDKKDYVFSIISLDNKIKNLSLKGFEYELDNKTVHRKKSLLISNVITKNKAKISFEKGKILVILRKVF